MTELIALKPCPAGCTNVTMTSTTAQFHMEWREVFKPVCECPWDYEDWFDTAEEAAAAWNTRVNVKQLTNSNKQAKCVIGLPWYTGLAAGGFSGAIAFGATGAYSFALASLYCGLVGIALFALTMHSLVKGDTNND